MKKFWTGIVVIIMMAGLCACGKSEVKGETYSTDSISAFCPEGWLAVTKYDAMLDQRTEDGITIYKGIDSEDDALFCPYVQITYYPDDKASANMENIRSAFTETEDASDLKFNNYTLTGYLSTGGSTKSAILWSEDVGVQITVEMEPGSDAENISLDDADVQAILGSFKSK